mmetsp:Transcript_16190/g.21445  ORF Transcript_16190/g.21445 Transcript_16190/m.21445 type:complete len:351 (+) Transcript_16190:120-1172(+)
MGNNCSSFHSRTSIVREKAALEEKVKTSDTDREENSIITNLEENLANKNEKEEIASVDSSFCKEYSSNWDALTVLLHVKCHELNDDDAIIRQYRRRSISETNHTLQKSTTLVKEDRRHSEPSKKLTENFKSSQFRQEDLPIRQMQRRLSGYLSSKTRKRYDILLGMNQGISNTHKKRYLCRAFLELMGVGFQVHVSIPSQAVNRGKYLRYLAANITKEKSNSNNHEALKKTVLRAEWTEKRAHGNHYSKRTKSFFNKETLNSLVFRCYGFSARLAEITIREEICYGTRKLPAIIISTQRKLSNYVDIYTDSMEQHLSLYTALAMVKSITKEFLAQTYTEVLEFDYIKDGF